MGLSLATALAVAVVSSEPTTEPLAPAQTTVEPQEAVLSPRVFAEHPACVREASPEALKQRDTVWIGAMFPLAHEDPYMREFGETAKQAVLLAQREILAVSGGIPRLDGRTTVPIGLVVCDDAKSPAEVAEYLTNEVKVSAVIGFGSSRDVVQLSNQTFVPKDVLVVTALNSSAVVADIFHAPGSKRLVWRTAANTRGRAAALGRFIPEFLEPLRRTRTGAPLRLALVARHGSSGLSLSADLAKFFGPTAGGTKSRPNQRTAPEYKEFHLFEDGEAAVAQNRAMASELRAFKPQVVILQNSEQAVARDVLLPLEEAVSAPNAERPLYVVTGSLETTGLADLVRRHPTLVDRLYGLTTPTKTSANMLFTRNFNAAFGTEFSLAESPGAPYDSLYLIAYAAARAADPTSGQSLAEAIPSLVGGRVSVDVGASSFLRALSELRAGQTVDLQGAFSSLDFDLSTGESQTDYAILCASGEKESFRVLETGLTYRAKEDRFSGKLECKD
jgi:ABC-type branched-subunit amino acid transport system substrate-binding protein